MQPKAVDNLEARSGLNVSGEDYEVFRLDAVTDPTHLPYSLRVLLENLLRHEDAETVTAGHITSLASWNPSATPETAASEVLFHPARVLMQDYSGVPCVVDLAAIRETCLRLGGDPSRINPRVPVELVVDHSVMADVFGTADAFDRNAELDYGRNRTRYELLRWAERAFTNLTVVPPNTGIIHQVNLERLARVVMVHDGLLFPDTVVGTDSHTPMVNGLGVLGWGVGGIEANSAMLGQPISMRVPRVIGCELTGVPVEGVMATDVVLAITERLREHGVVGSFVEFFGPGMAALPLVDRATIANMSPEFGSTCAMFPIDRETMRYLKMTGRSDHTLALVETYAKEQGLWYDPTVTPRYSERISFDLSSVVPSIAGSRRPQDRVPLSSARSNFRRTLEETGGSAPVPVTDSDGASYQLKDGAVVIAAITSCTNTSNSSMMIAAGLLARNAVERGLQRRPWVKSTLAPGSPAVMEYLTRAGLTPYLEKLGFSLVAYGCTTCIGNSGPLPEKVRRAIRDGGLVTAAVLSGNRNFEGRVSADVRMNYLASPPLVLAYALTGSMDVDLTSEPLGVAANGEPVYLADIWPSSTEIAECVGAVVGPDAYTDGYASQNGGDRWWQALPVREGELYPWSAESEYIKMPPYLDGLSREPSSLVDIVGAKALVSLGDSVTTDHISPAGGIDPHSSAGQYLLSVGVEPCDFNSYGARRTNHEVLIRGVFANPRLRNRLTPDVEGGYTVNQLTGEQTTVYEAALAYRKAGVPLVVVAGHEYGTGSSRDWAAKGPALLGVRAVIAESFERIHRSNLVGMGILPLAFPPGESALSLGLTGFETFDILGITEFADTAPKTVPVVVGSIRFDAVVRLDTPTEVEYFRHGGIIPYTLRKFLDDMSEARGGDSAS
jgi:aconitate hydratase